MEREVHAPRPLRQGVICDLNLAHSAIPGPKWPFFEFREKRLKNGWAYDPNG